MKYLLEVCLVALMLTGSTSSSAVTSDPPMESNNAAFAGTWTGNGNGLPAIKLTIQEEESTIRGDIVFYFQTREDTNHPWHIAGEDTGWLLSPHVEGKTLTFAVHHHRCHGCAERGPDVKFRMTLAGPNQAQLWKLGEGPDSGPGMILVRQTDGSDSSPAPMREGISVELAVTHNAQSMPDADQPDSLIVSVTAEGAEYFGIEPVAPDALAEKLKPFVVGQPDKKLYVKADARTHYVHVQKILEAINAAGVRESALLTSEKEGATTGTYLPPKGLEVLVGRPVNASSEPVVVQLFNSEQGSPALDINDENIPWSSLESKLGGLLNGESGKVVVLKADGQLSFRPVVEIADRCQALGAKVVLLTGLDN